MTVEGKRRYNVRKKRPKLPPGDNIRPHLGWASYLGLKCFRQMREQEEVEKHKERDPIKRGQAIVLDMVYVVDGCG